jgi:Ca2+-binding EF-hand superfamily protein
MTARKSDPAMKSLATATHLANVDFLFLPRFVVLYVQPNNNSNNGRTRGRFLLGRAGSAFRRTTQSSKSTKPSLNFLRSTPVLPPGNPQLSPLVNKPTPVRASGTTTTGFQHPRRAKQVTFQDIVYSKSPIVDNETVDATGFSRAELHDLEESFKLFDVYGEGVIQVEDLKGILEALRQEQQEEEGLQQQQQDGQPSSGKKYPHLETLLDRLSELADEDTLNLENYIQLMASTTISNAIMIENGGDNADSSEHFARVFKLFDADGKGYITRRDLERIAIELGEHEMTRGELQEMIDRALGGTHHTGISDDTKKVYIEDFTKMMTMNLFPTPSPSKADYPNSTSARVGA